MNYWWVNQNQTYAHEVRGGYLWSPKANANGAKNQSYENMLEVRPGDIVFSFADTLIKAVGVVVGRAESAPKPTAFGAAGSYWSNEGWFVEVEFRELGTRVRPRDHMGLLEPTLPPIYSPIRKSGAGNQGIYLAKVPDAMAVQLLSIIGGEAELVIEALAPFGAEQAEEATIEAQIKERTDIPSTEVAQLVKARRGQGLYKSRVELLENGCRVTGVRRPQHLVASHIKPWRISTDSEKLDGHNGLLLSPHIDHLFDRAYISFSDSGRLLVAAQLTAEVLEKWSIDKERNVGSFNEEQARYLEYHRDELFAKRNRYGIVV